MSGRDLEELAEFLSQAYDIVVSLQEGELKDLGTEFERDWLPDSLTGIRGQLSDLHAFLEEKVEE